MTELADFLLARIAEDERPDYRRRAATAVRGNVLVGRLGSRLAGANLRAWALPYADHPDYRQEWKP